MISEEEKRKKDRSIHRYASRPSICLLNRFFSSASIEMLPSESLNFSRHWSTIHSPSYLHYRNRNGSILSFDAFVIPKNFPSQIDNSTRIQVSKESVPREEEVSISSVASRESQQWSRRTFNGDVIRFVSPLYRRNGASRQEYGKIKNTRWRVKTKRERIEGKRWRVRLSANTNTFPR